MILDLENSPTDNASEKIMLTTFIYSKFIFSSFHAFSIALYLLKINIYILYSHSCLRCLPSANNFLQIFIAETLPLFFWRWEFCKCQRGDVFALSFPRSLNLVYKIYSISASSRKSFNIFPHWNFSTAWTAIVLRHRFVGVFMHLINCNLFHR